MVKISKKDRYLLKTIKGYFGCNDKNYKTLFEEGRLFNRKTNITKSQKNSCAAKKDRQLLKARRTLPETAQYILRKTK